MRPTSLLALLLILACGSTLSTGCAGLREVDEPQFLDLTGPVALEVESFNGDVIVRVDDDQPRAMIELEREALHGRPRKDEAEASLADIDLRTEVINTEVGQTLRLTTASDYAEPHLQRANLHITLPGVTATAIRTGAGEVDAQMIRGPVDIRTDQGDVRVMTNWAMTDPVTIITNEGDIDYRVRGDSTARFDAETVEGDVKHRIEQGVFIVESGTDHDSLRAVLNDGENPVILRAAQGDIRIGVVHDPLNVGQFMFSP